MKTATGVLFVMGMGLAAVIGGGCNAPAQEARPAPLVSVTHFPGGKEFKTAKVKVTRKSGVTFNLQTAAPMTNAEQLTISTDSGSMTFLKSDAGYATSRSGNPVAPTDDMAAIAQEAGQSGDAALAEQVEIVSERLAQPTVNDPNDPAPSDEVFVSGDEGGQSTSRCAQARADANNNNGAAVVSWSFRNGIFSGTKSGSDVIGPKTNQCMGRCGEGCNWTWAGTKYTQACVTHDACARSYGIVNWRCDLIFAPTIWDVAFNENCF